MQAGSGKEASSRLDYELNDGQSTSPTRFIIKKILKNVWIFEIKF